STAELAHRGGCGIDIDVDRVSRRERGMNAYEVMLSESQERMLLVVAPEDVAYVQERFVRWDLHSDVIGTITGSGRLVVREAGGVVCDLPLAMLIDEVPLRYPEARRPAELDELLARDPLAQPMRWPHEEALLALLHSPNIGSRRPVFRRYDHQVGDDTVMPPGGDAALVRVRGTEGAIALSTDGNARFAALDPRRGAAIAVCEAARNVVAAGARPLAVTNCLNFGNPEKPEVFWQLREAIDGIAEVCRALEVPVVSGNVSLYNDTNGVSIDPTAVIGMVGLLEDVSRRVGATFVGDGDVVGLVGPMGAELGGSEYQRLASGVNEGPRPELDLNLERRVQAFVLEGATAGLLRSCHDVSDGGLAVALAESCLLGGRGADIVIDALPDPRSAESRAAGILFGESQSRFLISFATEAVMPLQELAGRHQVPLVSLGTTGGDRLRVNGAFEVDLNQAREAYETALA
ncbi:MAG: AIR synthase-related protein, partial [Candidatus Dormibacteraeota bacterium]|nr:AIR synthase-related protein [Candidatus Dormibacteraeota bacterium]